MKASGLSTKDIDEVILVGGSTRIPAIQKAVEEFFGKAPSHAVNPDEAVAIGAAIQGAILAGNENVGDVVLLDVTPLNLGIETVGNVLTTLVESNTTIPCKKTMTFSNAQDMQPEASIMVFSGNRPMAYQNKLLGQFNIELTPSPKGMNQIEVSFDIDANGILTVSAVDKALNKPNTIRIESSSNLTKEEIDKMKAEADANAETDKKLKKDADTINSADSFAFSIEKSMEDMKDKISDSDKDEIKQLIEKLKKAVSERNVGDVKKHESELKEKWTPIIQKVYQSGQPNANSSNLFDFFTKQTNASDKKSDTDFEEVK